MFPGQSKGISRFISDLYLYDLLIIEGSENLVICRPIPTYNNLSLLSFKKNSVWSTSTMYKYFPDLLLGAQEDCDMTDEQKADFPHCQGKIEVRNSVLKHVWWFISVLSNGKICCVTIAAMKNATLQNRVCSNIFPQSYLRSQTELYDDRSAFCLGQWKHNPSTCLIWCNLIFLLDKNI